MNSSYKKFRYMNWILGFAFIFFISVSSFYFVNFNDKLSSSNGDWGTFGDFFGGTLNPLFALLSLLAIIYTIRIQTEELELTRKEMQTSNETLKNQKDIFDKQNNSIQQQTFENTFYKLLEHHNSLLDVVYDISEKNYYDMIVYYSDHKLLDSFKKFNNGVIKTFFMTFYQILKYIERQEQQLEIEKFFDPKLYTNILRATFDDALLCLLAINCQQEGFEKYKELLIKYEVLEHLNIYGIESVKNSDNHERILEVLKMYDEQIFGSNERIKMLIRQKTVKN